MGGAEPSAFELILWLKKTFPPEHEMSRLLVRQLMAGYRVAISLNLAAIVLDAVELQRNKMEAGKKFPNLPFCAPAVDHARRALAQWRGGEVEPGA